MIYKGKLKREWYQQGHKEALTEAIELLEKFRSEREECNCHCHCKDLDYPTEAYDDHSPRTGCDEFCIHCSPKVKQPSDTSTNSVSF